MIVEHPDKQRAFVMQKGTSMIATVDTSRATQGQVTIGHYGNDGIMISDDEWLAFIELVVEADRVKRGFSLNLPVNAIENLSCESKLIA